ncbi:VC0807 family protein [Nocardia sp. NPDC051570]|uniref:VC0807 family protein n=1 Tax=Nocardia sp. NPDC051570 TaxID=3364324 RepID=UPI00379D82D2
MTNHPGLRGAVAITWNSTKKLPVQEIVMTTATAAAPTMDRGALARRMIRDIGLPLGGYYALHALGASTLVALSAGTVLSGAVLLTEIVRNRKIDLFAGVMLVGFLVGLGLTFLSGDARFMLAKDSVGTSLIGIAFLGSVVIGKPLIYVAAQRGLAASPDQAAAFEERYRARPGMRRAFRRLSVMWGVGLLAESALKVALIYQLPVDTMVWLSTVLTVAAIGGLTALNIALIRRWRAAADRATISA